jgi:hypothetical protein
VREKRMKEGLRNKIKKRWRVSAKVEKINSFCPLILYCFSSAFAFSFHFSLFPFVCFPFFHVWFPFFVSFSFFFLLLLGWRPCFLFFFFFFFLFLG